MPRALTVTTNGNDGNHPIYTMDTLGLDHFSVSDVGANPKVELNDVSNRDYGFMASNLAPRKMA